jgi:hypothetical protein
MRNETRASLIAATLLTLSACVVACSAPDAPAQAGEAAAISTSRQDLPQLGAYGTTAMADSPDTTNHLEVWSISAGGVVQFHVDTWWGSPNQAELDHGSIDGSFTLRAGPTRFSSPDGKCALTFTVAGPTEFVVDNLSGCAELGPSGGAGDYGLLVGTEGNLCCKTAPCPDSGNPRTNRVLVCGADSVCMGAAVPLCVSVHGPPKNGKEGDVCLTGTCDPTPEGEDALHCTGDATNPGLCERVNQD